MAPVPSLNNLVDRWRELRRPGRKVPARELCIDCPGLAEELERHLQAPAALEDFLRLPTTVSVVTPPPPRRGGVDGSPAPPAGGVPGYPFLS
jgi:hypothetical protein